MVRALILLASVTLPLLVFAGEGEGVPEAERPKIGLVLSGGGAKGAAHIGVLKVLEANHIPVDFVAGTSIGAFVGGMYALGYSVMEIEAIMLNTNWAEGYSDTIPRQELSYRDKQQRDEYNIPLDLGYSNGTMKSPRGLLNGQTMSQLLQGATGLVQNLGSFDELSIPYRAVATNLITSEAYVLDSGNIVTAMQASAAVPGALLPVELDGMLLVDGGIANNMPVDVVKAMGADIVIAVDIGSALMTKEQLSGTISVLNQLSTILTNASTEKQKKLLTDKDVLIRPDVGDMSTTDFAIMPQVLPLGIDAAMKHIKQLQTLSVDNKTWQAYVTRKAVIRQVWVDELKVPLIAVKLNNNSNVSDELIRQSLDIRVGDLVNDAQLEAAINRVYSMDLFERVESEFVDTAQGRMLVVTTKAKSWGPDYFQLGINWEDDFTLESSFSFDFAYQMTGLNELGGSWRNELQFGSETLLASEFYQPLDKDRWFYTRARGQYEINTWDLFSENQYIVGLKKTTYSADLGIGYNFSVPGRIELGLTGDVGHLRHELFLSQDIDFSSYGGYLLLGYDTLDSISFPTSGNRINFNVFWRKEDFNLSEQQSLHHSLQFEFDWKGALSLGNHAFVAKLAGATVNNDGADTLQLSELGGFLNLSGFHKDALMGPHKLFGAVIYQYDLGRDMLGVDSFPLYLGISAEAGNVWQLKEDIDLNQLIYASSLYLGTDTAVGPAALGFGVTDSGQQSVYLFLGKNF
ncbi:patatin-like phospholipase family protein [Shewanella sp. NIFS-20-20]|nr:patatin-like phospholipase family protein [Shewanella sp. NIFS-20-20]MBV7316475.1 patatin-like phospholipase family protein [Shewanella sp. NIFS-20-20]